MAEAKDPQGDGSGLSARTTLTVITLLGIGAYLIYFLVQA
jgi:hypothetical protein